MALACVYESGRQSKANRIREFIWNRRRTGLIRWTVEDSARKVGVSVTTIWHAELTASATALTAVNDRAVRYALERAGN